MQKNRLGNLLEMLEAHPRDVFLIYAVGFEYESVLEDDEALKYYNKILNDFPDYLPVYYQAGLLHFRNQRFDEALKLLEKGMNLAREKKESKTLRELNEAYQMVEEEAEDS